MTKISKTMRFFTKIQNISIYNFGSKIQNISKYKNTKIIFGPPSPEKLFLDHQAQKNPFLDRQAQKTFLDRQVRKIHFWTAKPDKKIWTAKPEKLIFRQPSSKKIGPPSLRFLEILSGRSHLHLEDLQPNSE